MWPEVSGYNRAASRHCSRRWEHCSCDGVFNAHGVGRQRGSLWTRHAIADIADMLNGEQLAMGERSCGIRLQRRLGGWSVVVLASRCVEAVARRRQADAGSVTTGEGIIGVVAGGGQADERSRKAR
ncbi:hypothetical protein ACLOJK_006466 [Asimina triloba]